MTRPRENPRFPSGRLETWRWEMTADGIAYSVARHGVPQDAAPRHFVQQFLGRWVAFPHGHAGQRVASLEAGMALCEATPYAERVQP